MASAKKVHIYILVLHIYICIFRCFCLGPWQWVEAMREDPAIRKWIVLKAEMVHSPAPGNPVSRVPD